MKPGFTSILILLFSVLCQAQIQLSLTPPNSSNLNIKDGWNISIQNVTGGQMNIYLYSRYLDGEGNIVAEIKSQPFQIRDGVNKLVPGRLQIETSDYSDNRIRQSIHQTGNFPEGMYQVCTDLMVYDSDTPLGTSCFFHHNVPAPQSENRKKENTSANIVTSADITLEQYYAFQTDKNNLSEHPYTRLYGKAGVTAMGLPLIADIRLSTEKSVTPSRTRAISLSFDAVRFRENVRKKFRERLFNKEQQLLLNHAEDLAKLEELDHLEQVISDTTLQAQLSKIQWLQKRKDSMDIKSLQDSVQIVEGHLDQADYQQQKELLETALAKLQKDTGNTSQLSKADSLSQKLVALEKRKNFLYYQHTKMKARSDSLRRQISTWNEYDNELKSLKTRKTEYDKLSARHKQLTRFKKQLSATGDLPLLDKENPDDYDDPGYLRMRLKEEGMLSGVEQFFLTVDEFQVGMVMPQFSPLILQGIQVNGLLLSASPGALYTSVVGGRAETISFNSLTSISDDKDSSRFFGNKSHHKLIAGKIGIGKPDRAYLHFSTLYSKEDAFKSNEYNTGKSENNPVFGVDFQVPLIKDQLSIKTGIAYAHASQSNTIDTQSTLPYKIAHETEMLIRNKRRNTRVQLVGQYAGADYYSIGVPLLRTDFQSYSVRAEKFFWKRQFKATAQYRIDHTNLKNNELRGIIDQKGIGLGINLKDWPRVQINHNQIKQKAENNLFHMTTWQFMGNRAYAIGDLKANSMVFYNLLSSKYNDLAESTVNHQAQLSQTFTTLKMTSFTLNMNYLHRYNHDFRVYQISQSNFNASYIHPGVMARENEMSVEGLISFSLTNSLRTTVGFQVWNEPFHQYGVGGKLQFNWQISDTFQLFGRSQYSDVDYKSTFIELALRAVW